MVNLTFGEQVKIILSRKGMTIKQLAELVEAHTGKPMSRQNMTQRLGRDNFQEQDMRLIAEILGCPFHLSIMENEKELPKWAAALHSEEEQARDITIGELVQMEEEIGEVQGDPEESEHMQEMQGSAPEGGDINVDDQEQVSDSLQEESTAEANNGKKGLRGYFRRGTKAAAGEASKQSAPGAVAEIAERPVGEEILDGDEVKEQEPTTIDINPYTQKEYETNSVRVHPKRIGYVQVYDREQHKWTDMTEWAFLGYQERKKKLLGKDYKPPIYLD